MPRLSREPAGLRWRQAGSPSPCRSVSVCCYLCRSHFLPTLGSFQVLDHLFSFTWCLIISLLRENLTQCSNANQAWRRVDESCPRLTTSTQRLGSQTHPPRGRLCLFTRTLLAVPVVRPPFLAPAGLNVRCPISFTRWLPERPGLGAAPRKLQMFTEHLPRAGGWRLWALGIPEMTKSCSLPLGGRWLRRPQLLGGWGP